MGSAGVRDGRVGREGWREGGREEEEERRKEEGGKRKEKRVKETNRRLDGGQVSAREVVTD